MPSGRGDDPFVVLDRFHWAIAIVTVAGSTAFLLALMVMRAEERREIIGILRLMGIPPRSILVEVLLEGLLIATAGAVFGIADRRVGAEPRQPLLPVALRHDRSCSSASRLDRAGRRSRSPCPSASWPASPRLDAASPRRGLADRPMTSMALAWRTVTAERARAALAIVGVAVIGALLFDMLLLSRGLLVSFRELLDSPATTSGSSATDGVMFRAPIRHATRVAERHRRSARSAGRGDRPPRAGASASRSTTSRRDAAERVARGRAAGMADRSGNGFQSRGSGSRNRRSS